MLAKSKEFPVIGFDIVYEATQHFSNDNKLGEGGFGPVYKVIMLMTVDFSSSHQSLPLPEREGNMLCLRKLMQS